VLSNLTVVDTPSSTTTEIAIFLVGRVDHCIYKVKEKTDQSSKWEKESVRQIIRMRRRRGRTNRKKKAKA
jgi:hypothetical protein